MTNNRHNLWRKYHPEVRNATRSKNYAAGKPPLEIKKGRPTGIKHIPWSDFEKILIFMNEYTDRDLAGFLNRSVQAIQSMRWKILKELK